MKIKFLVLCAAVVMLTAACKKVHADTPANKKTQEPITQIDVLNNDCSLGVMKPNSAKTFYFKVKNTGNKPLVIYSVQPTCGCTVAQIPKKPIAPQKIDSVQVNFHASDSPGEVHKSIITYANVPNGQTLLNFTADIR